MHLGEEGDTVEHQLVTSGALVMSVNEESVKPKRRKRLATPPPGDDSLDDPPEDLFDRGITNTFNDLRTAKLEIPTTSSASIRTASPSSPSCSTSNDDPVIDLDQDELSRVSSSPVVGAQAKEVIEEEDPPSPPPPITVKSRHRRPNSGVAAALARLDKFQHGVTEDHFLQQPDTALAQISTEAEENIVHKIKVRVRMPSGVQRYEMKVTDRIQTLREDIAKRETVPIQRVSLFYDDKQISEFDTAKALGLTVADTVEAYILVESKEVDTGSEPVPAGMMTIKVQGKGGQREVMNIALAEDEPMDILMKKYAEAKKIDSKTLTFRFDGEDIEPTDTPASLDLEDGYCIDVTGC